MNIGDWLLNNNKITQKQREKAELEHEVSGNKFGKCCLDLGVITRTELNQAIKAVQKHQKGGSKPMPTEIGEGSKFTMDLKFVATLGAIVVSACATYFTMNASIDELKSAVMTRLSVSASPIVMLPPSVKSPDNSVLPATNKLPNEPFDDADT